MTRWSSFPSGLSRILISFLFFVFSISIFGCSAEPVVFRTVEIATPPQIIVGVDLNRFKATYPDADLEGLVIMAWDFRITFYGDDVYAPKWTGQGLSFEDCDRVVPLLLAKQPANTPLWLWFPINDHSTDKLVPTYNYWKAKGWLNQATWFFFLPGISDECRTLEEINYNNTIRTQFKGWFPEIKWMVTKEITQFYPEIPVPLGDVYLPMFHMFEMEREYLPLVGSSVQQAYSGVVLGGYVSGYTGNPESMEPGWYSTYWHKYFQGEPPNVPVLSSQEAGGILDYCKAQNMKFFLWWDILGLLDDVSGNPTPTDITYKLLGY